MAIAATPEIGSQELEDLKLIYQNSIEVAQKASENILMCIQLEFYE